MILTFLGIICIGRNAGLLNAITVRLLPGVRQRIASRLCLRRIRLLCCVAACGRLRLFSCGQESCNHESFSSSICKVALSSLTYLFESAFGVENGVKGEVGNQLRVVIFYAYAQLATKDQLALYQYEQLFALCYLHCLLLR